MRCRKTNNATHQILGMGATINGIGVPIRNNPIDTVYNLQLRFSDAYTSHSAWKLDLTAAKQQYPALQSIALDSLVASQSRAVTVDGWGSVTTPYGTFSALRVANQITMTAVVDTGTGPFPQDVPLQNEYVWLAANGGVPVLSVTTTVVNQQEVIGKIIYRDSSRTITGVQRNDIGIFPVSGAVQNPAPASVFDPMGRTVTVRTPASTPAIVRSKTGVAKFVWPDVRK